MLELNEIHFFQSATVMTDTNDPNFDFAIDILVGDAMGILKYNGIDLENRFIFLVVEIQTQLL